MTDDRQDPRAGTPEHTAPRKPYERPAVVATLPFESLVLAQQGEGCLSPTCVSDENGNPCP